MCKLNWVPRKPKLHSYWCVIAWRPEGLRQAIDVELGVTGRVWRLAVVWSPSGDRCSNSGAEALDAWQYASPTRRSRSWQRLAVGLLVFLELSSERIPYDVDAGGAGET
ncbi:hypothetical protein DEO72_LG4g1136 [Vigna unguiculata]|uniref:Uncharacterized protein n=1 Tax=Vigna unguiculata TaxID=3917 RepID=A0A4D6LNT8_VIGUN|nr:hypothetical protein DEO72_LG4g1136 [Vigna unguiculata]